MSNVLSLAVPKKKIKSIGIDILAITIILFLPAISHLFTFAVYYFEPMRIMVVIAIVHTTRRNAYLLAFTLPLFSFLVTAHPSIIKSLLIISELFLNVFLFFILTSKMKNHFLAMVSSLLISKVFYYSIKYVLLSTVILSGSLVSTPLLIQLTMIILFSLYVLFVFEKSETVKRY